MTGTEGCCAHLSVLASELENRAGRPLITVWLEISNASGDFLPPAE